MECGDGGRERERGQILLVNEFGFRDNALPAATVYSTRSVLVSNSEGRICRAVKILKKKTFLDTFDACSMHINAHPTHHSETSCVGLKRQQTLFLL